MGVFGLFKSENERQIIKLRKIADCVEALDSKYSAMTDEELQAVTPALKARFANGETLDDLLPDAFAVVREAGARVLNMKHFYVQLLGGIVLHQGRIAEMRTGEGKTLVATLPAYLNALNGKGMQVVTVNEYLARRDAEWMGKIYKFLGLTVGVNLSGMSAEEKRKVYACDIVYGTNNEFGFDYLRDNMAVKQSDKAQRDLEFAIVDEVDSILIDEARTPLIISGRGSKSSELYNLANRFARTLASEDYEIDEKDKTIRLVNDGVSKAERYFNIENLSDLDNTEINHHINQALRANHIMKKDSDYIVNEGEVVIVDEFTGRLMIGRRYSDGLHQAIEAKEAVKVQSENQTLATITFQNYFRMYKKLSGMTGTAKTEEEEFESIYNLDVVVLPTNLPMVRDDINDQLYTKKSKKINAVIADIAERHAKGQPILVGTVTVEKSEELSRELNRKRIIHNVLNAKNHEQEAEIVAQAGKKGTVTIATNMAGRGTDIVLGGNPEFMSRQKMIREGYTHEQIEAAIGYAPAMNEEEQVIRDHYKELFSNFKKATDIEKQEVIDAGGLHIIGTERHESRRIDNQLRGRAGRQGDPGSSIFYISMEDDVARIFGGERLQNLAVKLKFDEDLPISNGLISKQIEGAQKKIESKNFSYRKHVLSYDDVMNTQRAIIYGERNKVLKGYDVRPKIMDMIEPIAREILTVHIDYDEDREKWDYVGINKSLEERLLPEGLGLVQLQKIARMREEDILKLVVSAVIEEYERRINEANDMEVDFAEVERFVMLKVIDNKWIDHIDAMDMLRQGITLRAYGQRDPVIAYKQEGFDMFEEMISRIENETINTIMKLRVGKRPIKQEERKVLITNEAGSEKKAPVRAGKTIGRNDPCTCGSGKKYKNCCGKNA